MTQTKATGTSGGKKNNKKKADERRSYTASVDSRRRVRHVTKCAWVLQGGGPAWGLGSVFTDEVLARAAHTFQRGAARSMER